MGRIHIIGEGKSSCGEACGSLIWVKEGHRQPWHLPDVIVVPARSSPNYVRELTDSDAQGEENHKERIRTMASRVLGAFRQT